jgi:hypothetical protein
MDDLLRFKRQQRQVQHPETRPATERLPRA